MKKLSILLPIIIACNTLAAMEEAKPLLNLIATPAGGGVTLYLHPKSACTMNDQKQKHITNAVFNFPEKLLDDNNKIMSALKNHCIKPHDFYTNNALNPVWLLNECIGQCNLNRLEHPMYRKLFEDMVVHYIEKMHPDKTEYIVYTSFGSGYLFSDFVILTKLLQNGYRNIIINLVDTLHQEYIDIVSNKYKGTASDTIFDETHHDRGYWLRGLTYRFTQLLHWFHYYQGNIIVRIYPHMDAYANDCMKAPALQSDVLVAIDWLDECTDIEPTIKDLFVTGAWDTLRINGLFCSSNQKELFKFYKKISDPLTKVTIEDLIAHHFQELKPLRCKIANVLLPFWYKKYFN